MLQIQSVLVLVFFLSASTAFSAVCDLFGDRSSLATAAFLKSASRVLESSIAESDVRGILYKDEENGERVDGFALSSVRGNQLRRTEITATRKARGADGVRVPYRKVEIRIQDSSFGYEETLGYLWTRLFGQEDPRGFVLVQEKAHFINHETTLLGALDRLGKVPHWDSTRASYLRTVPVGPHEAPSPGQFNRLMDLIRSVETPSERVQIRQAMIDAARTTPIVRMMLSRGYAWRGLLLESHQVSFYFGRNEVQTPLDIRLDDFQHPHREWVIRPGGNLNLEDGRSVLGF